MAAGILVANPDNSQPWLFRIRAATIDLYADPSRQVGAIDPFRREMYIGLGCALENMALAAAAEGFAADVQLMPDPANETHAARQNDQIFVKHIRELNVPTAAAFGILAIRNGLDNAQRLACGRVWQRIHLWGATRGLAFQPLCQMCKRVDREQQLGSQPVFGAAVAGRLGDATWHAIMPFRIGYPMQASLPSPRRALSQVTR